MYVCICMLIPWPPYTKRHLLGFWYPTSPIIIGINFAENSSALIRIFEHIQWYGTFFRMFLVNNLNSEFVSSYHVDPWLDLKKWNFVNLYVSERIFEYI